jgi:hypothetical protein
MSRSSLSGIDSEGGSSYVRARLEEALDLILMIKIMLLKHERFRTLVELDQTPVAIFERR